MYINIIINKLKSFPFFRSKLNTTFLHDDGWLEVSLKMDERSVNSRHKKTIGEYKNTAPKYYNFSNIRYGYLKKTVRYLQTRGDVYLVRLPTHNEIYETENSYMPDFSEKMLSVAEQFGVKFIDLSDSNQNVLFTDANHLWKESGGKISLDIAREILKNY